MRDEAQGGADICRNENSWPELTQLVRVLEEMVGVEY
jgi:hypothetical protein